MRPNINDRSALADVKRTLVESNVSAAALGTIEKALKKGMVFKGVEDLAILNIPTTDLGTIGNAVDFGPKTVFVKNIKRVEYQLRAAGDQSAFYGYQLIVTITDNDGFIADQSFPIDDTNLVI